jgi:hypothetical protein
MVLNDKMTSDFMTDWNRCIFDALMSFMNLSCHFRQYKLYCDGTQLVHCTGYGTGRNRTRVPKSKMRNETAKSYSNVDTGTKRSNNVFVLRYRTATATDCIKIRNYSS